MTPEDLIAFIDESKKPARDPRTGKVSGQGDFYVVASAVVLRCDVEMTRQALTSAVDRLGFPLHYSELRSRRRKVAAISAVMAIDDWDALVVETSRALPPRGHSEHHVRARILRQAFAELNTQGGVFDITLESRAARGRGLDQLDLKDHQVLQSLIAARQVSGSLRISHATKSEPLLWIADLVAGARSDFLCGRDRETYGLVSERVRKTTQVVWGRP